MKKSGSITIFMALIMSVILALVAGTMESARMACARTQTAAAADVGLYSLFAQYDRELLERYDLFYLDGSYRTGSMHLEKTCDTVEEYMTTILNQNFQSLRITTGGITGYALATDEEGGYFRRQAEEYMKKTLGSQGIQAVLDRVLDQSSQAEEQQRAYEDAENQTTMEDYDQALTEVPEEGEETEEGEEVPEQEWDGENPIDTIREIKNMGILDLVLENSAGVSAKSIDRTSCVSGRSLETGMGMYGLASGEETTVDKAMFQEYILQKCASYTNGENRGLLDYQVEYILGSQADDRSNLTQVAEKLLLMREGVNFMHLLSDSVKRQEAESLALAIATAVALPAAAPVVETVLLLCWSFAESVLDVRELFAGGRVPYVKNNENWQLSLENLGNLLNELNHRNSGDENGASYEDYLRILLLLETDQTKTQRCMDMVEAGMRGVEGRYNFRMDTMVEAMEFQFEIDANSRVNYQVCRQYSY